MIRRLWSLCVFFLGACSHKQGDKNGSFLILKLRSGIDNAGLMVLRQWMGLVGNRASD